jgi:hypothetical protein
VRNALLAVAMARHGTPGGETVLEGEAGFYHAYAGNNRGELRYSFTGDNHTDLAKITQGLGRDWMFLETLYRIYIFDGRLQHRPYRDNRPAVRGAQYPIRRHRPHRGAG